MPTTVLPTSTPFADAPSVEATASTGAVPGACASCGAALQGEYCHACGERRMRPDELTLRAFARDVASEVGDLDSRAVRSIRYLMTRPGFLTAEFLAGRRRAYVGPLKLFLFSFAAMLVVDQLFSRPVMEEAVRQVNGSWLGGQLHVLAARLGTSEVDALERLNATAISHYSWISLLIPVLMGAVVALVLARRRSGYVGHLVFSAHVATFYFILAILAHPLELLARAYPAVAAPLLGLVMVGGTWVYLWLAVGRVYDARGWRGGALAAVLLAGFNLAQGVAGLLAVGTAALALLYL